MKAKKKQAKELLEIRLKKLKIDREVSRKCIMCIWEDMERERRNTDKTSWDTLY